MKTAVDIEIVKFKLEKDEEMRRKFYCSSSSSSSSSSGACDVRSLLDFYAGDRFFLGLLFRGMGKGEGATRTSNGSEWQLSSGMGGGHLHVGAAQVLEAETEVLWGAHLEDRDNRNLID
ncbi:hypothetical protein AAC387_Pa10g1568 [Persea americana]